MADIIRIKEFSETLDYADGLDVTAEVIESESIEEEETEFSPAKEHQFALIDAAARGSIDAAAELAEGYLRGAFEEEPNMRKGLKWASYAAKRGNAKAAALLREFPDNL